MPDRRRLTFTTMEEIHQEVDRLLTRGYEKAGSWDLAQVCNHCARWVQYPMDGFPRVPLWLRPIFWLAKLALMPKFERRLHEEQSMPAGMKTAPDSLFPPGQDEAAAAARLKSELARFEQHEGPLHPSPLRGRLSKKQWQETHLVHCAHHLSFLVPKN